MYNLQVLLFMNDYKNSRLPQSFTNYFGDVNVNLMITPRYNFMHRHAARTKFSSKLPFHHFPTSYNAIGEKFRTTTNKQQLKCNLTVHFLNNYWMQFCVSNLNLINVNPKVEWNDRLVIFLHLNRCVIVINPCTCKYIHQITFICF